MENLDHKISHRLADATKRSALFSRIAIFGATELVWFMTGALFVLLALLVRGPRYVPVPEDAFILMLGGIGGAWLVTFILEKVIRRSRPFQKEGRKALITMPFLTPSFPSAHATIVFAMVAMVAQFDPALVPPFLIGACLVSVSRVAVGVHYLTDIVAGAFVGYFVGGWTYLLTIMLFL